VRTHPRTPDRGPTRPPEPIRPAPAQRPGLTLLATRVRRSRHRTWRPDVR